MHLVPKPFDPQSSSFPPPVPIILIPLDKRSPSNWVPWKNGTLPIGSLYFPIPTACPPGQTEYLGTICPEGPFVQRYQIGWGPFVHGDRILGDHLSIGTELVGDHLFRGTSQLGTNCGRPNVRGPPYAFWSKCVTATMTLLNNPGYN